MAQDDGLHARSRQEGTSRNGHYLPPVTEADREAAFPDLPGHAVHDRAFHSYFLLDQLEWQDADGSGALAWDAKGWVGGDMQRLWFRAEGMREDSQTTSAETHALYGRKLTPWWDVVVGLRQDFAPGPSQTWAAIGIQGLAPYRFEIEATAYVGEAGQIAARVKAEYELLLTNRWLLQPLVELNAYGKDDDSRGMDAGVVTFEAGLRARYEIRREFAPYIGISLLDDTRGASDSRLLAGVRAWF
jgi:copper resistance protein B